MVDHPLIGRDPEIMGGTAVFLGTRVPIRVLFAYLKAGQTLGDFLDDFPTVTPEQAKTLLDTIEKMLDDPPTGDLPVRRGAQRPVKPQAKYAPLKNWLIEQAEHGETVIDCSFSDIERVLHDTLPPSAHKYNAWWANDVKHPEAVAWMDAGWQTESVNLRAQTVTFRRVGSNA